jgi:endogenous inhibitor of DNA gyrase (YacG/DUF329 family)
MVGSMSARLCLNCGTPVPRKPSDQPGPQPKYCDRKCQTIASHRAYRERNRRNAATADRMSSFANIDWARVPAPVLDEFLMRFTKAQGGFPS